jgi:hypothetical protein
VVPGPSPERPEPLAFDGEATPVELEFENAWRNGAHAVVLDLLEVGAASDAETDTSSEEPCSDDAACIELGLVCNESSGLCVAPDWAGEPVVADNLTALAWQGCPLGLSGDGCSSGFATKAGWAEQLAGCDALSWGGYDDWRLPDPYEMQTLVDHDIPGPPTTDATLFPATTLDWFWSSSSSVDTDWAWTLHFGFGTVASDYKPNTRSARCVRGGALQARHFEPSLLAGDPIVTDTQSGLIWQGCPLGLSGDACGTGLITWSTWADALAYCEGLAWAGLEGWRLPDINELQSIVDYRYESTSLYPSVFPGRSSSGWSSTTRPAFTGAAMAVNFEVGNTHSPSKEQPGGSARCVRDP